MIPINALIIGRGKNLMATSVTSVCAYIFNQIGLL